MQGVYHLTITSEAHPCHLTCILPTRSKICCIAQLLKVRERIPRRKQLGPRIALRVPQLSQRETYSSQGLSLIEIYLINIYIPKESSQHFKKGKLVNVFRFSKLYVVIIHMTPYLVYLISYSIVFICGGRGKNGC